MADAAVRLMVVHRSVCAARDKVVAMVAHHSECAARDKVICICGDEFRPVCVYTDWFLLSLVRNL